MRISNCYDLYCAYVDFEIILKVQTFNEYLVRSFFLTLPPMLHPLYKTYNFSIQETCLIQAFSYVNIAINKACDKSVIRSLTTIKTNKRGRSADKSSRLIDGTNYMFVTLSLIARGSWLTADMYVFFSN